MGFSCGLGAGAESRGLGVEGLDEEPARQASSANGEPASRAGVAWRGGYCGWEISCSETVADEG